MTTALIFALLVLGPALLIAEAHLPTYGVLGTVGAASLVAALVLAVIDAGGSAMVAIALAVPVAMVLAVGGMVVAHKTRGLTRRQPRGGAEGLVGHVGVVRRSLDPVGQVMVDGELWRARRSWAEEDEPPPVEGEPVVVDRVQRLTLSVRRAEEWELE